MGNCADKKEKNFWGSEDLISSGQTRSTMVESKTVPLLLGISGINSIWKS